LLSIALFFRVGTHLALRTLYQVAVKEEVSTACRKRAGLVFITRPLAAGGTDCMTSPLLFPLQFGISNTLSN
jgi:hypothetical protein